MCSSNRVWATPTRARYLPLPQWLKEEILAYVKSKGIKENELIFDRDRTTVYQRLSSYGNALGGKKKIGSDALRKSFGIWYLPEGGRLEDLQKIYSHNLIGQIQAYLAIDGITALKNFIEFQRTHSPYKSEEDVLTQHNLN